MADERKPDPYKPDLSAELTKSRLAYVATALGWNDALNRPTDAAYLALAERFYAFAAELYNAASWYWHDANKR
jgi:hypothetical protein